MRKRWDVTFDVSKIMRKWSHTIIVTLLTICMTSSIGDTFWKIILTHPPLRHIWWHCQVSPSSHFECHKFFFSIQKRIQNRSSLFRTKMQKVERPQSKLRWTKKLLQNVQFSLENELTFLFSYDSGLKHAARERVQGGPRTSGKMS